MTGNTDKDKLFNIAVLALIDLSLMITAIGVWGGSYKYLNAPSISFLILCVLHLLLLFGVDIIYLECSIIKFLLLSGLLLLFLIALLWAIWTKDMTILFNHRFQQPFSFYRSFILLVVALGYITAAVVIGTFGKYLFEQFLMKSGEYKAKNNILFFVVYAVLGAICLIISEMWPFKSNSS